MANTNFSVTNHFLGHIHDGRICSKSMANANFSGHIRENLEDELVQEALKTGVDLRHYSREIEKELRTVETSSIGQFNRSVNL